MLKRIKRLSFFSIFVTYIYSSIIDKKYCFMFLSMLNNSIAFNKLYIKDKTLYKIIYCKKNK